MTRETYRELSKDVMRGITLVPWEWVEVPVNLCPSEDQEETKIVPSRNMTPLIKYLYEQGWRKEQ